jgi:hypothetical protein
LQVAKNIILANFKSVTLHDNLSVTFADLAAHFYLKEVISFEQSKFAGFCCDLQLLIFNGKNVISCRKTLEPIVPWRALIDCKS